MPRPCDPRWANSLAAEAPELAARISPDSPVAPEEVFKGTAKVRTYCANYEQCGRTCVTRARHLGEDHYCMSCSMRQSWTRRGKWPHSLAVDEPEVAKLIHPDSPLQAHEIFTTKQRVTAYCTNYEECGQVRRDVVAGALLLTPDCVACGSRKGREAALVKR